MKILEIDYDYYRYPENIEGIEDFIAYANSHYNEFIKLVRFETENCVFPYFIDEDVKTVYVNTASVERISEAEAAVLCRSEYETRLEQAVKKKCPDCAYYEDNLVGDKLEGHRDKLSLDGKCWTYERKEH